MRLRFGLVLLIGATLCGGCPPEIFDNALPVTLLEIKEILEAGEQTENEVRLSLEALGISPSTINALMRDRRTANQYGGDPRSALAKVTAPRFTAMTPDEVQILGDGASTVDDELSISLTDEEAQAVVTFLNTNALNSPDELAAYLDVPDNTVPSTIPDGVLQALFIDFDPLLMIPILP